MNETPVKRRWTALVLAALVAGCSAPRTAPKSAEARLDESAMGRLWTALECIAPSVAPSPEALCPERPEGKRSVPASLVGVLYDVDDILPVERVADASGMPVFLSGPHAPGTGKFGLDLNSDTFGHYNPAFVAWAVQTGIVGEGRPAAREAAQPVYDALLQSHARIYWLVYGRLEAGGFPGTTPPGVETAYARYLTFGPDGSDGRSSHPGIWENPFSDVNESIPHLLRIEREERGWYGAIDSANEATGFWLRRREDGTLALFHDGLRRVLTTYDGAWLTGQG